MQVPLGQMYLGQVPKGQNLSGIIPLTPVDSGDAQAEDLPPLFCLTFFLYMFFLIFHSPLALPILIQHLNYNFQPGQAMSEVCSLLIKIGWRPLGCSGEGVSLRKELHHGGNKNVFPVRSHFADQ